MDTLNLARNCDKRFQAIILSVMLDDGVTGDQWIEYFKERKNYVSGFARSMLQSHLFDPTIGFKKLNIAILKGEVFKSGHSRLWNVFNEAECRAFIEPSTDLACYLMKNFSSEDMKSFGLEKVVVTSKTIEDYEGDSCYFRIHWNDDGPRLEAHKHDEEFEFDPSYSFAFAASEECVRIRDCCRKI